MSKRTKNKKAPEEKRKIYPIRETRLEVVQGKEGNQFKFRGFRFDTIYAGCFESAVTNWKVPVIQLRVVDFCADARMKAYAHFGTWSIKWFGGHDATHRLVRVVDDEEKPGDTRLDAALFCPGDILVIFGHKDRITRKYVETHGRPRDSAP